MIKGLGNDDIGKDKRESQSTKLVNLVLDAGCELFHDDQRRAYCSMKNGGHVETWPIRRKGFKQWMSYQYFLEHKKTPSAQGIQDAIGVIEGKALYEGKEEPVFIRVAGDHHEVF